jgi:hypothetical protein
MAGAIVQKVAARVGSATSSIVRGGLWVGAPGGPPFNLAVSDKSVTRKFAGSVCP